MQFEFTLLHHATRQQIAAAVAQLAAGDLPPHGFGDAMAGLLEDAHTRAVVLGRAHAGDLALEEADDRHFAEAVVDDESEYLAHFVEDLEGDGDLDQGAVGRRAALYADRLAGTANEAWALALPDDTVFVWELGARDESNCDECPARALGGPYTAEDLPGYPGDNSTPCVFNCRCRLLTDAGQSSFTLPDRSP